MSQRDEMTTRFPTSAAEVYLSVLLRRDPIVLIFYRGEWRTYRNLQLGTFRSHLDQILALGAQLVAVSPQRSSSA